MIRRLKIAPRLLVLISVQALVMLVIGVIAVGALRFAAEDTSKLNRSVDQIAKVTALADGLRSGLVDTVYEVDAGTITWDEARGRLKRAEADFEQGWELFYNSHSEHEIEHIEDMLNPYLRGIESAFAQVKPIFEAQDRSRLSLFVTNDLSELVNPFVSELFAGAALRHYESQHLSAEAVARSGRFLTLSIVVIVIGLVLCAVLGFAIYRSISLPLGRIAATVQEVSDGNFQARTEVDGPDELGALGATFDGVLNDRVATLARAQEENEQLNNAVVQLLQAVYQLSQRDLTVKVPVTEDVTGPVADSLNLLTFEMAKVLQGVLDISFDVARTSKRVKEQSDTVITAASAEQQQVNMTSTQLAEAAESMAKIAELARACNEAADRAIQSTVSAHDTVADTVNGITAIRETIRETEKRIKRLGERSQEINRVVNLINTIAERTHILALNASMHAASAGEAGRGFVVVADEVQRLAESARDATLEISTLVSNIQMETADTVTTMNEAISQVVDGTQLAEQAGKRMQETQKTTADLVAMVQQIAQSSQQQASSSMELRTRADEILRSSQGTNDQLREQTSHTDELVVFSQKLLDAVSVFTLPDATSAAAGATRLDTGVAHAGATPLRDGRAAAANA